MSHNKTLQRFTRGAVYRLARRHGGCFDLYRDVVNTTDRRTGKKVKSAERFHIKRGLILPAESARKVFQTVSHITSMREFIYGGYFDQTVQGFVWDEREVGPGFVLKQDDWIVYNGKGFKVLKFTAFEGAKIYAAFGKSQDACGPGPLLFDKEACDVVECSDAVSVEFIPGA